MRNELWKIWRNSLTILIASCIGNQSQAPKLITSISFIYVFRVKSANRTSFMKRNIADCLIKLFHCSGGGLILNECEVISNFVSPQIFKRHKIFHNCRVFWELNTQISRTSRAGESFKLRLEKSEQLLSITEICFTTLKEVLILYQALYLRLYFPKYISKVLSLNDALMNIASCKWSVYLAWLKPKVF